jgi:hypothetical protein
MSLPLRFQVITVTSMKMTSGMLRRVLKILQTFQRCLLPRTQGRFSCHLQCPSCDRMQRHLVIIWRFDNNATFLRLCSDLLRHKQARDRQIPAGRYAYFQIISLIFVHHMAQSTRVGCVNIEGRIQCHFQSSWKQCVPSKRYYQFHGATTQKRTT